MVQFTPFLTLLNTKKTSKETKKGGTFDVKEVKEILVSYEDGSTRALKKGISLDLISPESAVIDCKDLSDEDILTFITILAEIGRQKGIIPN